MKLPPQGPAVRTWAVLAVAASVLLGLTFGVVTLLDGDPAQDVASLSPAPPPAPVETSSGSPTPTSPVTPPTCSGLRFLTLNIHHAAHEGELRLELLARDIERWRPDVIALQEVDRRNGPRSADVDQASWLARRLGMEQAYGANVVRRALRVGAPERSYGNAILSRYPILDTTNVALPHRGRLERRGLLVAHLDVNGVELVVANTHLQPTSRSLRTRQMESALAILTPLASPRVLVGDLNAEPGSPPLRTAARVFTDLWPAAGVDKGLTVPASDPRRRIDYVLGDAQVTTARAVVRSTAASDHRGVQAWLRVCAP